jgi:transposase
MKHTAKPKMLKFTKKDFDRMFPDDATCLEWLKNYLYPDGIYCKQCEQITKHHRVQSRPSYSCDHCGHHVHPTADTIFHKSPTALTTWFYAIYLMSSTRCGISAKQIERETGVTYKTAWRMFKQIRTMLDETDSPIGGNGKRVETDEMYVGPRTKRLGQIRKPKTPVVGMVERTGRVIAVTAFDTKKSTLHGIIKEHVLPRTTVFTDDYPAYDGLHPGKYNHYRINHSAKIYVSGNVHTQTIEGFWSLVKNGMRGVYHSVGSGYLQSYLNEYSFRYNRRSDIQPMFTSFMQQIQKRDAVSWQAPVEVQPF